jgi:hypothetical protein
VPEFLNPKIALVTASVETDVLGIDRDALSPEALGAVTAAHPHQISSGRILRAFNDGNKHRPHSTFGNVNAAKIEINRTRPHLIPDPPPRRRRWHSKKTPNR